MHESKLSDEALIAHSLDADPECFQQLFHRHGDRLHTYFARRVGSASAEDLSADLWLAAFRTRRSFDSARGSVIGWIYGIARNLVRQNYRTTARWARQVAGFSPDVPDVGELVIEQEGARHELARTLDGFRQLAAREQEILALAIWDDLTYAEIAQVLNTSVGTVRSRLSRARRRLARLADLDR